MLWRDNAGNVGLWLVNGTQIMKTQVLGNVGTNWSVIGQRDFTGSGNTDVLWRDTSGNIGVWVMNGTSIVSTTILGNVPTTWSVVGTGNFDTSGSGAILWRDNIGNLSIWFMSATNTQVTGTGQAVVNSGVILSQTVNLGNVPVNWTPVGADSSGDIVWRNTTTGDVAMWTMNGGTVTQAVDLGVVPLSWTVAGIGDFDGNGSTDILWRDTSGNVGIWLMNGTSILSSTMLGNVPVSWSVAETGDFDGDAHLPGDRPFDFRLTDLDLPGQQGGRLLSELVAAFDRIGCPPSVGITRRFASDSAILGVCSCTEFSMR